MLEVFAYGDACSLIAAHACAEGNCHVTLVDEQEYHAVSACVIEYLQVCVLGCVAAVYIYVQLVCLSGLASY